jgi:hemerythrin
MKSRKKRRNQNAADVEKLKSRFLANKTLEGKQIVFKSNGEKMSEVLLEFIEPYKKHATTPEAYRKLIALAVIAWDAALLEGSEKQNLITRSTETILGTAGEEWRKDLQHILTMLIERKERHFADNKRYIIDYQVSETKDNYHLSVISTP